MPRDDIAESAGSGSEALGERQDDAKRLNTSKMIFNYAELVSFLSQRFTLYPGDILTGTPAGVGMRRGVFLQKGDKVTIAVENIGDNSRRRCIMRRRAQQITG